MLCSELTNLFYSINCASYLYFACIYLCFTCIIISSLRHGADGRMRNVAMVNQAQTKDVENRKKLIQKLKAEACPKNFLTRRYELYLDSTCEENPKTFDEWLLA